MAKGTLKLKLTEVGSDKKHQKAAKGIFRAMIMIDSCLYRIADDVVDRNDALQLCLGAGGNDHQPYQVFDGYGIPQIVNGKLIPIQA